MITVTRRDEGQARALRSTQSGQPEDRTVLTAATERGTGGGTCPPVKGQGREPQTDPSGRHGQLAPTKQRGPLCGGGEPAPSVRLEPVATQV